MMKPYARAVVVLALVAVPFTAAAQNLKLRMVVANAAGDNLHIIDPVTNRVIGEVTGLEVPHGIAAAPDGSRLYVTNEVERSVDVIDTKTLKISKRIALSGQPNNIAISNDGRRVYAAIISAPGGVDVVDTATLTKAKRIPLGGMVIHNPFMTPDGKYLIAASNDAKTMMAAVIDQKTEEPLRTLYFDGRPENPTAGRPRPLAFSTNPDGSTKWVFTGLTGLHGFVVTDFETGKELRKITFPSYDAPVKMQVVNPSVGNPNHGIGVQPGNKSVWVSDRWYNVVHVYSLPDLKYVGAAPVGVDPFWVTFTPDGKYAYIPNDASASVSAIDTETLKEIARIPVGWVPKRVIAAMLP
jgi:YVTN family beta-propeller protein